MNPIRRRAPDDFPVRGVPRKNCVLGVYRFRDTHPFFPGNNVFHGFQKIFPLRFLLSVDVLHCQEKKPSIQSCGYTESGSRWWSRTNNAEKIIASLRQDAVAERLRLKFLFPLRRLRRRLRERASLLMTKAERS